jgi:beta-galactosidase GanA
MPVHSLYLDIFQKIKALGFNAVSFYTFWGLHEPKRGAGIDFSGFRNVTPFVEAAQEAGIYLIARPGPYMCVPRHASRRRAAADPEQQRGDDRRRVPRLGCVRGARVTMAHIC